MLSRALETHECAIGYRRPLRILCIAIRAHLVLRPALQLPKKLRRLSRRHRRPRRSSTTPAATLVVHQQPYAFRGLLAFPTVRCASARVRSRERKPEMQRERERSPERNRETERQTDGQRLSSLRRDGKNITHAHAHAHAYVIITLTRTMMTRGCNAARLARSPTLSDALPRPPLRSASRSAASFCGLLRTAPRKPLWYTYHIQNSISSQYQGSFIAFPERTGELSLDRKKWILKNQGAFAKKEWRKGMKESPIFHKITNIYIKFNMIRIFIDI